MITQSDFYHRFIEEWFNDFLEPLAPWLFMLTAGIAFYQFLRFSVWYYTPEGKRKKKSKPTFTDVVIWECIAWFAVIFACALRVTVGRNIGIEIGFYTVLSLVTGVIFGLSIYNLITLASMMAKIAWAKLLLLFMPFGKNLIEIFDKQKTLEENKNIE